MTPCPMCGAAPEGGDVGDYVACRRCDVQVLRNPPSASELAVLYGEDYYRAWGEGEAHWELKRSLFRKLLAEAGIALPAGARALDVGCATGACLSVFADLGWEPFGIDVNPHAVSRALHRVPKASVFAGEFAARPAAMSQFDIVVLSDIIEHLARPRDFFRQLHAALRPGAHAVFLTPDIHSLSARLMGRRWPHYKAEHLVLFGRDGLRRALEEAGFAPRRLWNMWKPLSLGYAAAYFSVYRTPVLSALVAGLSRCMPASALASPLFLPMGEMAGVATRRAADSRLDPV